MSEVPIHLVTICDSKTSSMALQITIRKLEMGGIVTLIRIIILTFRPDNDRNAFPLNNMNSNNGSFNNMNNSMNSHIFNKNRVVTGSIGNKGGDGYNRARASSGYSSASNDDWFPSTGPGVINNSWQT